jgi:hypothetical protein
VPDAPTDSERATALAGDGVGRAGQHADKTEDAEQDLLLRDTEDEDDQTHDDPGAAEQESPHDSGSAYAATHGGGELGILGVERPLHLLEQTLLVVGERHVDLLRRTVAAPTE